MEPKVLKHVAVIPDGNRRFARKLLENPSKGHEWGFQKVRSLFEWCKESGIRIITFYTLSLENLNSRPQMELDFLIALARREIKDILTNPDNFVNKNKVNVQAFGKLDRLPEDFQKDLKALEEHTKDNSDYHLNLAIAYGGRQELVSACKRTALAVQNGQLDAANIDETVIKQNLWTNGHPDPDLVIRTGGEKRLSNFLLFQSAYSELAFSDKFWPEFTKEDFQRIVNDFSDRERRFGK